MPIIYSEKAWSRVVPFLEAIGIRTDKRKELTAWNKLVSSPDETEHLTGETMLRITMKLNDRIDELEKENQRLMATAPPYGLLYAINLIEHRLDALDGGKYDFETPPDEFKLRQDSKGDKDG